MLLSVDLNMAPETTVVITVALLPVAYLLVRYLIRSLWPGVIRFGHVQYLGGCCADRMESSAFVRVIVYKQAIEIHFPDSTGIGEPLVIPFFAIDSVSRTTWSGISLSTHKEMVKDIGDLEELGREVEGFGHRNIVVLYWHEGLLTTHREVLFFHVRSLVWGYLFPRHAHSYLPGPHAASFCRTMDKLLGDGVVSH